MRIVIGIVIALLGAAVGIAIGHYHGVPLEDKINIVDVVTLLATVFLAIYIPNFLEKYIQDRRSEKDVVIRKVEQLQNSFKEVNNLVNVCYQTGSVTQSHSQLIIGRFTTISTELDTTKTLLDYCFPSKFTTELNNLITFRRRYKNIVTGGRFQQSNYKYDAVTKSEEERLFGSIDREICLMIIKINRA